MRIRDLMIVFFLFSFSSCRIFVSANIAEDVMEGIFAKGITVDLKEPTFCSGVLSTTKGGVITGPGMRVQAANLVYTRKVVDETAVFTISASGSLCFEFEGRLFVGEKLSYDFQTKTGVLLCGRTRIEPWYIGGDKIEFCPDGNIIFYNAYITTSEGSTFDWEFAAKKATLSDMRFVQTENLKLHIFQTPVFWLPHYKLDLCSIFESPLQYRIKVGGEQGTRLGITYEIFKWNRLTTFLRFDYRLDRGPGAGIETTYLSKDHKTYFETINYIAKDSAVIDPSESMRYRFQGNYKDSFANDKVTVSLTYDKLSDRDMATDYDDQGLDIEKAGKTELLLRRQERSWITNLVTDVRINNFQTLKQELPFLETTWRPFTLGSTGIISDNLVNVSYLDFVYDSNQLNVHDYHSARIEIANRFYKGLNLGSLNLTPQVGSTLIYYANTPEKRPRILLVGLFECEGNVPFHKRFGGVKHVMQPYTRYNYLTFPSVPPSEHYIFDITDGWYRMETLRFGARQGLYFKSIDGYFNRSLFLDMYAYAFINTNTVLNVIPKIYADAVFMPTSTLRYSFSTAWDVPHNEWDHFNLKTELTIGPEFAVSAEYRHRNSYSWRKAQYFNFILDSYRTVEELRHSSLSDRRDTALVHLYYRFHPNWALEAEMLRGWDRLTEPGYIEYEIDATTWLQSAAQVKLSFQHKTNDHRFAVYFSLGMHPPDPCSRSRVPLLDY